MSSREEFEAWASGNWVNADKELRYKRDALPKSDPNYNDYVNIKLQAAWEGWRASRQALEVKLPETEWFGDSYKGDWALSPEEVSEALREAGVRVKP